MAKINEKKLQVLPRNERAAYFNHKISFYRKPTSLLVLLAGLVNLLMLIPDLTQIENESVRISIIVIRAMYSIILFVISYKLISVKSFKPFSIIVTICEVIGTSIFLFVFCQYSRPDFLIQSMGLITLFLVVFLIPNRWVNMLLVTLFSAVSFFVCALVFVKSVDKMDYIASLVYVSIALLLCSIAAKNSEKHQFSEFMAKKELERISTTDFLTKTANRYKMKQEAEKWIAFCRRQGMPLSIVFADINDMKGINDLHGHAVGDFVLKSFVKLIQNHLRASDTLARWGGDEFVFLLPNTSFENAFNLTSRIEKSINEFAFFEGSNISCSFGVIEMKDDSDFISMVNEADKLMYASKKKDKDSD